MEGQFAPSSFEPILTSAAQIYFVFIVIDLAALAVTWKFFPEFKGLSLEEIDLVFETPDTNPVALSKKLQKAKREKREEDDTT